jgi:hypothetical protein
MEGFIESPDMILRTHRLGSGQAVRIRRPRRRRIDGVVRARRQK